MSTRTFTKLGAKLDEESYEWLLREHAEIAVALENEILTNPDIDLDALRRWLTQHLGEHRQGMIQRCIGAARHLQGQGQ